MPCSGLMEINMQQSPRTLAGSLGSAAVRDTPSKYYLSFCIIAQNVILC